ncbi:MAG: hypothetical protein JW715_16735 [Sedimentisphaerales bacterium]|nr:hypothetical protein [Sedimentisphaerales bacterium]
MKSSKDIERLAKNIRIKKNAVNKNRILAGAQAALNELKDTESAYSKRNIWRIIMQSRKIKLTAAAIIIFAIILGINFVVTPIDGANTAFAAAMDHVKQARTFSCIRIMEMAYEDGENEGKFLFKSKRMFKEPNLERHVKLTSPTSRFVGEITITDYGKRQCLVINPVEKTAVLSDISYEYNIDPGTGRLVQTQLYTRLRDKLLDLAAGAVEDIGMVTLSGRSVRMLRSTKDNRVTTVWIDPETKLPVQIEHTWPEQNHPPITYTEIKIDTELNDSLFSLKPPEDYTFTEGSSNYSDAQSRISTKMRHLLLNCFIYASERNGQYPKKLSELKAVGITDQILKNLLTSQDNPNGPVLMRYRPPREGSDPLREMILYQIFEKWPADGAIVGFADGHIEIILDKNHFEELIK